MNIRAFYNQYWRFIFLIVVSVLLLGLLYTWKMTILPFVVGLLMAYLLMPLIRRVESFLPGKNKHTDLKRALAIILVLFAIMGVFALIVFLAVSTLIRTSADLFANASRLLANIQETLQGWIDSISASLPESVAATLTSMIEDATTSLTGSVSGSSSGGGGSFLTGAVGFVMGFSALPLFLFYLLKDSEKIQFGLASGMPPGVAKHSFNVLGIIESVLGRWVRQELMLGAVIGTLSLIGLLIIRVPFAPLLAIINGICEMIPTVGPIIGGAIMAIITLALAPDKVVWVIVLAVVVQLLENMVLVPRIASSCMRIHPTMILVLLVMGGYLWGLWGMVLTVPLTATMIEVVNYVRCVNHQAEGTCLLGCWNKRSGQKTSQP
jgi:predicted PurR-regulated permease PerM